MSTPLATRKHVGIFGQTNAGKSTLFNSILGQNAALVSSQPGTTTDPVIRGMELIPFGPVTLIDTAGLGDMSALGDERMKRTRRIIRRCDLAIYAADSADFDENAYNDFIKSIEIPHLLVFTKGDLPPRDGAICINDLASVEKLKTEIARQLQRQTDAVKSLLDDIVSKGDTVLLVVPIDSEAPKDRLILPQVQLIRNCLDIGATAVVTTGTELANAITSIKNIDLVVTDSQIFDMVNKAVPRHIKLTSFSMLLANNKCGVKVFAEGALAVSRLNDGDKVLVAESCTHNHTHEDIGRVKIPALLRKHTCKNLTFDFKSGYDFPDDLSGYALVIHCGGCMTSAKEMRNRINQAVCQHIPVTNYGVILAYFSGALERGMEVFV